MEYRKPYTINGDEDYLSYYKRAKDENNFGVGRKFEDRLLSDRDNFIHEVVRRLNYYSDQESWLEAQYTLMIEELGEIFKVMEEYCVITEEDRQYILCTVADIARNAFDHAKSNFHANFRFSKTHDGILFTFILADEGLGIRQHLVDLFNSEEFMKKFREQGIYAKSICETLAGGDIDQVYQVYLSGQGASTRLDDPRGFFFGDILREAIEEADLDLIMRDNQYEHTFSNKKEYISHDTIRELPYKLVYHGAKLFPNKRPE